jgi:O-antigen/teichoic acid export membrane protein
MDFLIIYGGRILIGLLLLLATRIYSTILSDYEIGLLGVVLASLLFFSSIIFFPIGSFINQKILLWIREKRWKSILISYFFALFFFFFFISLISSFFIDSFTVLIGFFFLLSLSINQTFVPLLNVILHRKAFVSLTLLTSSFYILFSYNLTNIYKETAYFWIIGQSLSNLLFGLVAIFLFVKLTGSNFRFSYYKINRNDFIKLIQFIIPLAITSLCTWLILNSFKITGGIFIDLDEIAVLILCSVLSAGVFGAIESATFQYFHAEFLNKLNVSQGRDARRICFEIFFNKVFLILSISLIALLILSPFIIGIALDERFHKYYLIFQIFLVSDFLKNVNHLISQFAYAEFKTKLLLKGNIFAAMFTISSVLLLFLIKPDNFIYLIPISIAISYLISILIQYNKAKNVYANLNLLRNKN